ncbi:MAG: SGNH/GDSL hydrolase family protein [Waterburya sp.]
MFGLLGTIDTVKISYQTVIPTEISLANFEQTNSEKLQLKQLTAKFTPKEILNTHQILTAVSNPQKITANNENFNYSGRIDWQNPQAPAFGYPGTAVKFKFTGTSLQIELSEDNWGDANFIDVYLDDNPQPITIELKRELLNGEPVIYNVAEGLENKVHNAVLIKRTDYVTGEFNFHSIIIDGEILAAEPDSQRTIEVYGDSISSGATVEYEGTGVPDPEGDNRYLSNAYYSYGAILARHYNAELSLVAQSGISLVNGFGYWNTFWNNGVGAEAIYDKVKPLPDAATWNFNNYTPDLIIIAYGQNDSGTIEIDKDISSQEWKEHYKKLLINLRTQYPNAYFIGMFPNMFHDPKWDNYLTEAIAEYRSENNDQRVFSLIHQQVTPGHPRISEQQLMADTLTRFIDQTLTKHGFKW